MATDPTLASPEKNLELEAAKDFFGFTRRDYTVKPGTPWKDVERNLQVIDSVNPEMLNLREDVDIAIYLLKTTSAKDWNERLNKIQMANGNKYPNNFWLIANGPRPFVYSGSSILNIATITEERWKLKEQQQ